MYILTNIQAAEELEKIAAVCKTTKLSIAAYMGANALRLEMMERGKPDCTNCRHSDCQWRNRKEHEMGDRRELKITIEFYSDGRTVANMWKHRLGGGMVGALHLKHGEAKCHPDDKFDPEVGSMIALARLFGNDLEFHTIEEKPKKKPERKLTDAEKKALEKGYTLVRDRLPSCTAYDGRYSVMDTHGGEGGGLYWDHKGKTFTCVTPDHMSDYDRNYARKIWMEIIAWKPQPDAVEQKALDEGYTLCRDRYPDKSGQYDVMTENGVVWHDLYWNGDHFGTCASLWMTKGENPAIAWKERK